MASMQTPKGLYNFRSKKHHSVRKRPLAKVSPVQAWQKSDRVFNIYSRPQRNGDHPAGSPY